MCKFLKIKLAILIFTGIAVNIHSQENPDDYWFDNGFTDGDTVYTNSGYFYDDGGDSLYQADQTWQVTFCTENGNPITLDFDGFRTDYRGIFPVPDGNTEYLNYDYMTVSFGSYFYYVYNDDTPQFSLTSPDGCMTLGFQSQPTSLLDSGWVAEISANPPPPNNDPCSAAVLPVGNVCSPGFFTNKGAYDTRDLESPACHEFFGGDVWFTAVVPDSGQLKVETIGGSLDYAIMVVYSGSCDALVEETCIDNPGNMPSVILSGRTPGETLYFRIFGDQAKSGNFGICATDPSVPISGFKGPGGVGDSTSNLLWLNTGKGLVNSADNPATDGDYIQIWEDQSGNENHVNQPTPSDMSQLISSGINNLPVLQFDGNDDHYQVELGSSDAPLSFFTVNRFTQSKEQTLLSIGDADDTNTASISRDAVDNYYNYTNGVYSGPELVADIPYIIQANHNVPSPNHTLRLNGAQQLTDSYTGALLTDGSLKIGADRNTAGFFAGDLSEVIFYNKVVNQAQELIITNYLAARYTINIGPADMYPYEADYSNDVAGIGRVDQNNIHTKAQSAGILSVGGASDLDDGEFLLFGHDGGSVDAWTTNETPGSDPNTMRIEREWIVHIEGSVGEVSLGIEDDLLPPLPDEFLYYNIIVDEDGDGDFSTGSVSYGMVPSGNELVANNVQVFEGMHISILAVKPYVYFSETSSSGIESDDHPGFDVELNYAISEDFELSYYVKSGTATQGEDFSLIPGSIVFDAGQKLQQIQPLIIDDSIVEIPFEYFLVALRDPSAGVLLGVDSTHEFTIIDDDLEISVSASDSTIGVCEDSETELVVKPNGQGPYTISWTPTESLTEPTNDTTIAAPTVTTTYTVSVTDNIGNTKEDTLTIFVEPLPEAPEITASGPLAFCEGDSVILSSSEGAGYLWSDGSTIKEIVIKTDGEYSVRISDIYGCASEYSDTVSVEVYPLPEKPVITANTSLTVCEGDTVRLTTDEADSYVWSTGDLTQSIELYSDETVTLQVRDVNNCLSPLSDPVEAVFNPNPEKPVITFEGDTALCEGENITLTAPEAAGYLWSTAETTREIIVDTTGNFSVQVINSESCISPPSDTVFIVDHALPDKPEISASGPLTFCEGNSVTLTAPLSESYLWSNGETTQSIDVSGNGTFTVRVFNEYECESEESDAVTVTVNSIPARPDITIDGSVTFCEGDSVVLTAPLSTSYMWSNGETSQSITVKTSGTYNVIVENDFGCESMPSEDVQTVVNPLPDKPEITVTGDVEFCEGSSVELQAPLSDSYEWSGGETSQSITVNEAGIFSVVVIDENNCKSPSSDPVTTTVNPLPAAPQITPSGEQNICEGESVTLTTETASGYLWSTGETTKDIDISETGTYSVKITDENGCQSLSSPEVEVNMWELPDKPVITPSGPVEILMGDSAELVSTPADNYLWSTGETTQNIYVKEAGKYSLVVSAFGDCYSQLADSVEVIVIQKLPKPDITVEGELMICEGQTTRLTAEQAFSYEWSNGETSRTIEVSETGSYTVVITNDEGVPSLVSDPVGVIVNPNPVIEVQGNDVSCFGGTDGSASVDVLSGVAPYSYNWAGGGNSQTIDGLSAGEYSVTVTDDNTCTTEDNVVIDQPDEINIEASLEKATCPDAFDGSISVTVSGGTNPYVLNWSDGSTGYENQNLSHGDYSVEVRDLNNCTATEEFSLGYDSELCFIVPEIITPNNDGKNDFWIIEGLEIYPDVSIEVYDRWGKKVFYSDSPDIRWDGTFNGKELPMESYHYIINLNNGSEPIIGNLTIVR